VSRKYMHGGYECLCGCLYECLRQEANLTTMTTQGAPEGSTCWWCLKDSQVLLSIIACLRSRRKALPDQQGLIRKPTEPAHNAELTVSLHTACIHKSRSAGDLCKAATLPDSPPPPRPPPLPARHRLTPPASRWL